MSTKEVMALVRELLVTNDISQNLTSVRMTLVEMTKVTNDKSNK